MPRSRSSWRNTPSAEGAHLLISRIGVGLVQLAGNTHQEFLFGVVGVELAELLPLGILGLLNEAQQILFVEGELAVVVFRLSQQPAIGR